MKFDFKKLVLAFGIWLSVLPIIAIAQTLPPSASNLAAREKFRDDKFGLFIHWGLYSQLANGEWIMQNSSIPLKVYEGLATTFNPYLFDANAWVSTAKAAGMKYITVTTRHHDGFSMFGTAQNKYNIVDATPFKRDVIKELAEACKKQGITLNLYYSLLDWHHNDFFPRGRTGAQLVGRDQTGKFENYVDFMCKQLTELLTNYGPIGAIWFDGEWDAPRHPWNFPKIYNTIHNLQPACLIGNNSHVNPIPGQDFQMFEKDLPGQNTSGFIKDKDTKVSSLPLETCETMNMNWGYTIADRKFKSTKDLVHYMANAAILNANFLLNIGPMPSGLIQPECIDTLAKMGTFMASNGEGFYNTRGGVKRAWGGTTIGKNGKVYLHLLHFPEDGLVVLPPNLVPVSALVLGDASIKATIIKANGIYVLKIPAPSNPYDTVIALTLK